MDGNGLRTALSRIATSEAIALLASFLLLVTGGAALADRYVDPSGEILKKTASAALRAGSYRFMTTQRYSGAVPRTGDYAAGIQLEGAVDIREGVTRFATIINLGRVNARCTYIEAGNDLFVSVHRSRQSDLGAQWLRTKAKGAIAAANLQGLRPDQLNAESAKLFEGLERDGRANIRGVPTTRYRGEVDIAALAGGASRSSPSLSQLGRTLPVEVYVDDDDLLRRLSINISAGERFAVRFTTDLFDYGDALKISRPPASSVKAGDLQNVAVACYPTTFPGGSTRRPAG